jgi:hypothetical protein
MSTQTQVDIIVVWRSRLAFFFSSPVEPDREDPNRGQGLKARQFSSGRTVETLTLTSLGRNLLVGLDAAADRDLLSLSAKTRLSQTQISTNRPPI